MTEVVVVCEGPTERAFTLEVLAHHLAARRVFVQARLIPTSRSAKGGALNPARVLRYLRNTLRERTDIYVTTFFDLYGLHPDFPGLAESRSVADPLERARRIEQCFREAVVQETGCRPTRFLPHVQPYEFEALLFSDVGQFAEVEPRWALQLGALEEVRRSAASPEHINDGPQTHPSVRLEGLSPRFSKVRHGVTVAAGIDLGRIRVECRHFGGWLDKLEALSG